MRLHAFRCNRARRSPVAGILMVLFLVIGAGAQTVQIDAAPSHVVNTFSPLRALGTTVDRIPSNTTDIFFRPDQVKQILPGFDLNDPGFRNGLPDFAFPFPRPGEWISAE